MKNKPHMYIVYNEELNSLVETFEFYEDAYDYATNYKLSFLNIKYPTSENILKSLTPSNEAMRQYLKDLGEYEAGALALKSAAFNRELQELLIKYDAIITKKGEVVINK